jgi:biopolymer transport protein ExbD
LTVRIPRQQTEKARIEIIPMIDIIFFLLVFFMVSTLSMTINRGLPVNLPKAASSQRDLRESFNITVMQDGTLFLNKEPTSLEALGQRVKDGLERDPELVVIINADDQALHGAIVSVMDEVRLSGVSRLAIAVRPERRAQP